MIPKALTKQAAAVPLVSASKPTATGITTTTSGTGILTPPSSDWKTSHSDAKPLSGGRAEMAAAPIRKNSAVQGIRLISPPISSMLRAGWRAAPTRAEKQQALEGGMIEHMIQPADEAECGSASGRNDGTSARRQCR